MSEIAEFTRHLGNYLPLSDLALVERAFALLRLRAPRPVPQERRAVHHPSARGREHPVAVAPRRAGARRRAAARRDGGHLRHQVRTRDEVRQAGRRHGRRRVQARPDRVHLARGRAGRELPQDAARDGAGRPRHPDQARRPPAQHAHARRDGAGAPAAHRARDARHLRADRQPARPQRAVPGAAGPRVQAHLPAAPPDSRRRRSRRRAATAAR